MPSGRINYSGKKIADCIPNEGSEQATNNTRTTEKSLFQINAKYCYNGKNAIVNDAENISFK